MDPGAIAIDWSDIGWREGAGAAALLIATLAAAIYGAGLTRKLDKSTHRIAENLKGERVEVVEWSETEGYVRAGGELWRASSAAPLSPGDKVTVAAMDGLVLEVRKLPD